MIPHHFDNKAPNYLEVRLDRLAKPDFAQIRQAANAPVIFSCLLREEGGQSSLSRPERAQLLLAAAKAGAYAVDIDERCAEDLASLPSSCKKIVSHHDWQATPNNLVAIEQRLRHLGDIVKIATTANALTDNVPCLHLLESVKQPTICFAMGENGKCSRALAPLFGSLWTYCAIDEKQQTAPGQWTCEELQNMYPAAAGLQTKIFGVIGKPISHSLSPWIYQAAFHAQNINAVFLPFAAQDLEQFLQAFDFPRLAGLSVTHPFKEQAYKLAKHHDEQSKAIGASNTLVREGKNWIAYNTDGLGGMQALAQAFGPLRGRKILLMGAGGAARALAYAAKQQEAKVLLAGRRPEKARNVKPDLGIQVIDWSEIGATPYDILVNATPVGMYPNVQESPIPNLWIRPGATVFDMVYNPAETKLLREATGRGAKTLAGLEMFVQQAALQYQLFAKQAAPMELFRAVGMKALGS